MVTVDKVDEVFLKVDCDESIAKELSSFFTFKVPNHQFTPAFRKKRWDGKIRLFNLASRTTYAGLTDYIVKFCQERFYPITINNDTRIKFTKDQILEWLNKQTIYSGGKQIIPHSYQIDAVVNAIINNRILLLSPTGSGKSLIIYLCIRFLLDHTDRKRFLIVVPTTGLVTQLASDFVDYSNRDKNLLKQIHTLFQGHEKTTNKQIVISTWQSIFREAEDFFTDFYGVIGDECHLYKAKSLVSIMRKLKNAPFRIGTTGTLDGTQAHKLIIEGLFGRCHSVTTTKTLIDDKVLSSLNIQAILLSYSEQTCRNLKKIPYAQEMEWIITNKQRNNFISNLASHIPGNVLVLFNFVERHGIPLHDEIKAMGKKETFMIYGKTEVDEREEIRHIVDKHTNSVLVASYGTCSTGINIKNINAIIFASPSKSVVRILQSIGRGLRKSEIKDSVVVYDIGDDLRHKSHRNHTLKHMDERLEIYTREKFTYDVKNIRLKEQ